MTELRTIARHAGTVLVGQLAVMASATIALALLGLILPAILWRAVRAHRG